MMQSSIIHRKSSMSRRRIAGGAACLHRAYTTMKSSSPIDASPFFLRGKAPGQSRFLSLHRPGASLLSCPWPGTRAPDHGFKVPKRNTPRLGSLQAMRASATPANPFHLPVSPQRGGAPPVPGRRRPTPALSRSSLSLWDAGPGQGRPGRVPAGGAGEGTTDER